MRKYARIENGKVMEVFDLDEHHPALAGIEGLFHPSVRWVPCEPACVEGWVEFGGAIVPPDHYKVRRAAEYPPLADLADALVKLNSKGGAAIKAEGQAQLDAYVAACEAVKAKHPKPGVT